MLFSDIGGIDLAFGVHSDRRELPTCAVEGTF